VQDHTRPGAAIGLPDHGVSPDDAIVCVDCGAAGSLQGVLAQGDGLLGGLLTEITEALRAA
jgi:hypothetical protein